MSDPKIRCLLEDREGNVWIGTTESGVLCYHGRQFINYSAKEGLLNQQVWAICKDMTDNLWMGTNAGVYIYNPEKSENILSFHDI